MIYALAITIAAGLLLLALLGAAVLLSRHAIAGGGWGPLRGWRWYPSPLGLLLLLPLAALILWRFFPAFLFIPIILPFFWRGRLFRWRPGRGAGRDGDDRAIDGQYRRLDED